MKLIFGRSFLWKTRWTVGECPRRRESESLRSLRRQHFNIFSIVDVRSRNVQPRCRHVFFSLYKWEETRITNNVPDSDIGFFPIYVNTNHSDENFGEAITTAIGSNRRCPRFYRQRPHGPTNFTLCQLLSGFWGNPLISEDRLDASQTTRRVVK